MAVKELALITEKKKRKKKESVQAAPTKPIKETISNNKGTTKINRSTISTKPSTQKTPQNRVVTNKERLTSKPTISDIRTVKTSNFKPKSIQTVDLYERGGRYFYKDGKKEKEVDQKFVQNALKNNKSGVIGRYDSKGKLKETDSQGNVKTAKAIRKEKFDEVGKQLNTWKDNIKSGNVSVSQAITDAANTFDAATELPGLKQAKIYKKTLDNAIINATHGIGKGVESGIDLVGGALGYDTSKDVVRDLEKKLGYTDEARKKYEEDSLITNDNIGGKLTQAGGQFLLDVATGKVALSGASKLAKAGKLGKIGKYIDNPEAYTAVKGLTGANKAKAIAKNTAIDLGNKAIQQSPMILSAGGRAFEESSAAGATPEQQREYAIKRMGMTAVINNAFNGLPGLKNDKGFLDKFVGNTIGKPIAKITDNIPSEKLANGIKTAIKTAGRGTGEGFEENLEGVLTAMLKNSTYSEGEKYTVADAKEDFLISFVLGSIFGYGNVKNEVELENATKQKQAEIKDLLAKDVELKTGLTDAMNRVLQKNGIKASDDSTINDLKNQLQQTELAKQIQVNEINQRVNSGEIDAEEGNVLLDQVDNGTYAQNKNLETIAIRQKEQLDRQLQQGLITDEQYNQELRDIANATKQTREQINTPQNQVETQPQTNETTQDNAITQETQNTAQNEQNEGTQDSAFNNAKLEERVSRDKLLDTQDLINEVKDVGAKVDDNGYVTVYHQTTPENAQKILDSGKMTSNEQAVFFSTSENASQADGRGNVKLEFRIPAEQLELDDLFSDNADVKINLNGAKDIDVSNYLVNNNRTDNTKTIKNENIPATKENVISEEAKQQQEAEETTQQEERKQPEILDKMPTEKKSTIKSLKKGIDTFRKKITDAFAPVYDMARKTRNMTLYHKADKILGSDGMAQVDLGRNQVDLKGKPFKNFTDENGNKVSMSWEKAYDSYSKIPNKAKNEFLVHQLNIDRLNQGVDQFDIPLQESQQRVEELRKQYKDIDKWSENTYQFYRNLIQNMVDNGRIPQSLADKWLKETPHFIHIERQVPNKGNQGVSVKNGKVDSDNLIRKIKGGNYAILPIKETTANYVQNARRAFAFNDFGKEYARTIGTDARGENVSADTDIDEIFGFEPEFVNSDGSGNYTLKIYENGTPVEIPISEDVYNSLSPKTIPRVGVLAEATKIYKDLLTNKNPFFGFLRNPIKDVGDMFLYSKHPLYKSLKTYTKLFGGRTALRNRKITKDGVTAQDIVDFYHNTGNAVHSFYKNGQFKSNKGNAEKGVDKVLSPIEKGNDFMESMPRITEFWNTIESEGYTIKDGELVPQKGKTPKKTVEQVIAEASYNAADVTVNFKRGGRTSKMISQNGGIFFNPSVQGASKFTRNITEAVGDAKAGDFQAAKRLILRAAGMGVAPAIINAIMYGDDDDYKELQDYQKDQYYLINKKLIADKLGIDNDFKKDPWIRIPKGRALSLFESATRRALDKGKGGKFGAKDYGQLVLNQIAPSNPLDNNIFSPITSAITNKSWSGNKIVSDSMAKRPVEEQFNEKTDELSKKLGKQLHISPMKINYVINQYSGVLGDLVLPQITPKASTGSSNPITNILRDNYSFDAANSSKNVGDFYDVKGKLNTKASGLNPSSKDKLESQYMNKQAQKMYALYDKKQKIQMDKNLSKKEKYQQALEVQKEINKFAKKATENVKKVDIKKNTATIGNDLYYKNKNSNSGWSQENEKTTQKREALGLSPEKYYYYKNDESYKTSDGYTKSITSGKNAKQTIAMVEAFNFDPSDYLEYKSKLSKIRGDKGANGKTIRYSARKKKIAYLNTLPISSVEKAYLMKQSDRYYKSSDKSLKKAIKSSSMSEEDKKQIYSYLRLGR